MSPAVSAQQIIFSPGTHCLLRLFALLSSEACVTPTIHTYIHTSPNTGNGYHSNRDPDLFASFSSLTSKRPIYFSHGKKCITLKSLINSAQLWELWGNKEKAKLVVSPDEHDTRTHRVQWGTSFQPGSFHWLDRGHWQIHSLHGRVQAFSKGCHELWMCCVWVPLLTSSFQNSHFSTDQNR